MKSVDEGEEGATKPHSGYMSSQGRDSTFSLKPESSAASVPLALDGKVRPDRFHKYECWLHSEIRR